MLWLFLFFVCAGFFLASLFLPLLETEIEVEAEDLDRVKYVWDDDENLVDVVLDGKSVMGETHFPPMQYVRMFSFLGLSVLFCYLYVISG